MKSFSLRLNGIQCFLKSVFASTYFFIILFLFPSCLKAANYYISKTDSLSKLKSFYLKAGDSVLIERGGIFYGSIKAAAGVIYSSYGKGNNPVITGFSNVILTGTGNNKWEAPLSLQPQVVSVNGLIKGPAKSVLFDAVINSPAGIINSKSLPGNYTGGEVVTCKNSYVIDRGLIISQTGGVIIYSNTSQEGMDVNTGGRFFIQNHPSLLKTQNDWCYFNNRITVYSTTRPSVKISSLNILVTGDDGKFYDIDFEGAGEIACNGNNSFFNCRFRYIGSFAIHAANAAITVEGNSFYWIGNNAINLEGCKKSTIRNNTLNKIGLPGTGQGLNITSISYTGIELRECDGTIVEYNTIKNCGYHGISWIFGSSYTVQFNRIDSFCLYKTDGGGIYTWNGKGAVYTGNKISNNIVSNGDAGTAMIKNYKGNVSSHGIYLDDLTSNCTVLNNTCYDNTGHGIFLHRTINAVITGNILYNNGKKPGDSNGGWAQLGIQNEKSAVTNWNLTVTTNIFVAKNNRQTCLNWDNYRNGFRTDGVFDSNIYARPVNDVQTIRSYINGELNAVVHDLPGWKKYSGQDLNSKRAVKKINSLNDLRFEYNSTALPKTISLGNAYTDMHGKNCTTITLQPYTSVILILNNTVGVRTRK